MSSCAPSLAVVVALGWVAAIDAVAEPAAAESPESAAIGQIAGDIERGRARSAELYCSVCHGPVGVSETPEWPTLAGQVSRYLARQLHLFRVRERISPEMEPIAASLSDQDIADLAVFYAAQQPTAVSGASGCAPAADRLYRHGEKKRAIEPCADCHGAAGAGREADGQPALRAQQAIYTAKQLEAYAAQRRYRGQRNLAQEAPGADAMHATAQKLTREEIEALASCLQRFLDR
jgi:cytochrome c553